MQGPAAFAETPQLGLSGPFGTLPTLDVTLSIDTPAKAQESPLVGTLLGWDRSDGMASGGAALHALRGPRSENEARAAKLRSRGTSQSVTKLRRMNEAGVEHLPIGTG